MPKIDLADYRKREQEFVKHCLLGEYLPELGFKVGSAWDALAYIDGFAGPWGSTRPDLSDSSFAVALRALRACRDGLAARGRDLRVQSLFVEKEAGPFRRLDDFARANDVPGFGVKAYNGEFAAKVSELKQQIHRLGRRAFTFIFLDPMGWKDTPMAAIQKLAEGRSSEVLINLMTKHIKRFIHEDTRADSYRRLFGREGVLDLLQQTTVEEQTDRAVREYCKSLQQICKLKYVSQAVILEPAKSEIRYFLVYGTNHHRGIEVFKQAEIAAAEMQGWVRHEVEVEKTGQDVLFFDEKPPETIFAQRLRGRYLERARDKVLKVLISSENGVGTPYVDLFCAAMAFPLVTPDDLNAWLLSFEPHVRLVLDGSAKRKKPSCDESDRVEVLDRCALDGLRKMNPIIS